MYQILTYPRSEYDERKLKKSIIYKLILKHADESSRLKKLKDYYLGQHQILKHERREGQPNFRTVANHAKDIADTATGYFMGNAIKYSNTRDSDTNLNELLESFDGADIDEVDSENALNMSIYGRAYEYIYAKEDETELDSVSLEPENTFLVYDSSVEKRPLFAVYYYDVEDAVTDSITYHAEVLTENYHYSLTLHGNSKGTTLRDEPVSHNIGTIPVIEYPNNKFRVGDYEQQISLIDAYNSLMGNRVNDKEQAIESILVLYGAQLADSVEEVQEAMKILRDEGVLELPSGSKAEFLKNMLEESSVEVLRKALKEDIYTFSHVPNLSDENFAGNSSGVAMEFKLLGLEMITKTKEAHYKRGLRQRIKIFANYLGLQQIAIEAKSIVPQFSRGLPKNLLEISQIVNNLDGKVSLRQLVTLLPFVEDPDAELEALEEQKKRNLEDFPQFEQKNTSPEEELDEQEE